MTLGCIETDVVVVQTTSESSFDLTKGLVYNVDIWVKNEGSVSHSARVTADLISNIGETRDTSTQVVNLQPGEVKKVRLVLDGENGLEYTYEYYVEQL